MLSVNPAVFLVAGATLAQACTVTLDIEMYGYKHVWGAETGNRVCAYGKSRSGDNVSSCVGNVYGDGETLTFNNGRNLSKSKNVYLEIASHDALWLDTITTWYDECNCSRRYGIHNKYGWCMSTDRNDASYFGDIVPAGDCFRVLRLDPNGLVYGRHYSYGGRRLEVESSVVTWSYFESLPEESWVELPAQGFRRLENEMLPSRLATLEEGM